MNSSQRCDQYYLEGGNCMILHHVSRSVCSHSVIKSFSINAGPVGIVTRLRGWMSEE